MDILVAVLILVVLVWLTKSLLLAVIFFLAACLCVYAYRRLVGSRRV